MVQFIFFVLPDAKVARLKNDLRKIVTDEGTCVLNDSINPLGVTFLSKYNSKCKACDSKIKMGDKIQWYGKGETFHYPCRPDQYVPPIFMEQEGYYFEDFEASGLDPDINAPVQIAVCITDNDFNILKYFSSYIDPFEGAQFSDEATAIHGLTEEFLRNQYFPKEEMICEIVESMTSGFKNLRYAGFNTVFDLKVRKSMLNRVGKSFDFLEPALDAYPIAKHVLALPGYKLVEVQEHYGIKSVGAHNAFYDIGNTVAVTRNLFSDIKSAA